ncbi:MAG: hypothetical protein K6L75_14050 [Cellvibrionaceae bacterium]
MNFVLVIQFPENYFESHEDVISFEEKLIALMSGSCEVDGHDIGSGTVNFFVNTNSPLNTHKIFRKYLGTNKVEKNLRISYRAVNGDSYTNLWPYRDPRPFAVIYPSGIDPFSASSKRIIPKRSLSGVSKFETLAAKNWF